LDSQRRTSGFFFCWRPSCLMQQVIFCFTLSSSRYSKPTVGPKDDWTFTRMVGQRKKSHCRFFSTEAMVSLVAVLLESSSSIGAFQHASIFPSSKILSSPLYDNNSKFPSPFSGTQHQQIYDQFKFGESESFSRRGWLSKAARAAPLAIVATAVASGPPNEAAAASDESRIGAVTDKVYVDVSGLSASASAETGKTQRIVMGLFGTDAPSSVKKLKLLHETSGQGLSAPCKPLKEDFLIQREQLEANKVYRSCVETQDKGVTYDYAQIWRIVKDERIDFGSLSGRFNAREYPTWAEKASSMIPSKDYLEESSKYLMAVRKGSASGQDQPRFFGKLPGGWQGPRGE